MNKNDKTSLVGKVRLFSLTNIVIANMIGTGIFTTSGLLMEDLKNPLVMISLWIIGGVLALCGALSYGKLGAAMPHAGGEYVFLSRLFHPLLGFLSGWVSFFVGFSAPIAAASIGFTEYLSRAFPQLMRLGIFESSLETVILKKLYSILVIVLFSLVHLRRIEVGTRIQNLFTLINVGLIGGLVILGFSSGNGDMNHMAQGEAFHFDFGGLKTVGLSLLWIMFAYSGWNASVYIGSEIKNPRKNLPRSLIWGTGIVTLLYFCLNLFFVYAVSPEEMSGVITIGGLAAKNAFGHSFEHVFSILICFALLSSLSAFVILGPRVYYSMAKDGYFFKFAAKIHDTSRVPSKSIILQCTIATLIVLSGTLDQILTYMGFSLGIFPILAIWGVFKLRRRQKGRREMAGFPVAPSVYMFAGTAILVLGFLESPFASSIAILTVLAGIPFFFWFRKKYGIGEFEEKNLNDDDAIMKKRGGANET